MFRKEGESDRKSSGALSSQAANQAARPAYLPWPCSALMSFPSLRSTNKIPTCLMANQSVTTGNIFWARWHSAFSIRVSARHWRPSGRKSALRIRMEVRHPRSWKRCGSRAAQRAENEAETRAGFGGRRARGPSTASTKTTPGCTDPKVYHGVLTQNSRHGSYRDNLGGQAHHYREKKERAGKTSSLVANPQIPSSMT